MAKMKVHPVALQQFLDAGHSQADAAKHFGVSAAAISQRVAQARIATSKIVAMERAAQVVEQKLTAAQRLHHAQQVILEQLLWAEQQTAQPGVDRAALCDTIVKLSAEVRSQLRLEHDVTRTLIDLKVVKSFQRVVFQAIHEESPEVAQRILAKLKALGALRASVDLPSLDDGGGFDVA